MAAAAYAEDCTLSWAYKKEENQKVIQSVNRQLKGERW